MNTERELKELIEREEDAYSQFIDRKNDDTGAYLAQQLEKLHSVLGSEFCSFGYSSMHEEELYDWIKTKKRHENMAKEIKDYFSQQNN